MHDSSSSTRRERNLRRLAPRARKSSSPIVYQHSLGAHRSTSALKALEQVSRLAAASPLPTSAAGPTLVRRTSGLSLAGQRHPRAASNSPSPPRRGSGIDARDFSTVSLDSSAYNRRRLAREPHLYSPEIAARFNRICDLNGINAGGAEVMVVSLRPSRRS
ncbi:hypothetical protein BCR35DRAFT_117868 [Leucosporidium creatinivorum]|uniref:Uncharacterized protein n=1 Tax=Leucosporidium creatinivorum TaxID=106004 RepID=A0A1Y2EZ24_9BASI|nr:hypothetical protein BCR35DRAFT_117868 [Leucosporidium creatinivorum]